MKVKNKKTGEIGTLKVDGAYNFVTNFAVEDDERKRLGEYDSLAKLNEEWEDYEEPKEYWHIFGTNITKTQEGLDEVYDKRNKEIGNYFETKEKAERAVERLRAWKRLKDKGFSFINFPYKKICKYDAMTGVGNLEYQVRCYEELEQDLDLLFGGEE